MSLTTALITHLASLFNHAIALLCHVLKALFFTKIGLKFSLLEKKCKIFEDCWELHPQNPEVAPIKARHYCWYFWAVRPKSLLVPFPKSQLVAPQARVNFRTIKLFPLGHRYFHSFFHRRSVFSAWSQVVKAEKNKI